MSARLRIIAATTLLAVATPYVAGLLTLGYGFNEQSRHGALYHWLYAAPKLLAEHVVPYQETLWLLGSMVIYAIQYLAFFALLGYAILLFSRGVRMIMPMWSEPTAHLIAWLLAGTIVIAMLSLLGDAPLLLSILTAIIAIWVCTPSLTRRGTPGQYADNGT